VQTDRQTDGWMDLLLCIEIFICRTDLYSATAERWWCHLPNRNVCTTQIVPMRIRLSVPLRSDIKGTMLPPANVLIPLERHLIALRLCRWQYFYNETLQQTFRPLLSNGRTERQTAGQIDGIAVATTALAMWALRRAVKIWYKNIAGRFFGLVTKHACDRRTDGQTDRITTLKTALA